MWPFQNSTTTIGMKNSVVQNNLRLISMSFATDVGLSKLAHPLECEMASFTATVDGAAFEAESAGLLAERRMLLAAELAVPATGSCGAWARVPLSYVMAANWRRAAGTAGWRRGGGR